MLTGLESLLRTLATVLVVLLGWLPVGSILSGDGPIGSAIPDAFSGLAIAVGGVAENESADILDGPRAVSGDDEALDDAASEAEQLDDAAGGGERTAIDAEQLDDAADGGESTEIDAEELDDAGSADVGGTLTVAATEAAGSDVETLDDAAPVFDDFEDLDDLILPDAIDELADLDDANAGSEGTDAAVDGTSGGGGGGRAGAGAGGAGGGGGGGGGRNGSGGRMADGVADFDCADFASQAEAQMFFDSNGGTIDNNVAGLDANANGQACEDFDYGQAASDGGGGGGRGAAAGSGGGGGGGGRGDGGNGGGGGGGRTASGDGGGRGRAATGDGGGDASTEAPGGNGRDGGGSAGGNGAAAVVSVDVSSCRTVASSNGNVAATGCDSVARANVAVSGGNGGRGGGVRVGGEDTVIERGADVRTRRVIERSAQGGTEIEIDRGGDENGEGERLRSRRPAADRSASRQIAAASNEEGASGEPVTFMDGERWDDPVLRWLPEVKAASNRTGVSKEQIAAVMRVTSGGDPQVLFPDGAVGLLKVPAEELAARGIHGDRRTDPQTNVQVGAEVLAQRLAVAGAIEPALRDYVGDGACLGGSTCGDEYALAALDWIEYYRSVVKNPREGTIQPLDGFALRDVTPQLRPGLPAIEAAPVVSTSPADASTARQSPTVRRRETTKPSVVTTDSVVANETAVERPAEERLTVAVSAAGGDNSGKGDGDRKELRRDSQNEEREAKDRRPRLSTERTGSTTEGDGGRQGQGPGKREKKR